MAASGRVTVALAASAITLLIASPLKAEEGDYSFWQTLANLVSPPKADNKVTAAQRQGSYPLRSNPSGFADGFSPGAYSQWQTVQLAPESGAVCGDGAKIGFEHGGDVRRDGDRMGQMFGDAFAHRVVRHACDTRDGRLRAPIQFSLNVLAGQPCTAHRHVARIEIVVAEHLADAWR
jgi:hypothetical protein